MLDPLELRRSRTYSKDVPLLKLLHIPTFEFTDNLKHYIGQVKFKPSGTIVTIFVTCYPAQFWKFKIETPEKTIEVETGSGALSDYWPSIELMVQKCLVITSITDKK